MLPVVLVLLNRVLRPLRETKRYTDDIHEAGLAIGRNLQGLDEAAETARLAGTLPGLAPGYLARTDRPR